ncbi:MAG: hypothetical protein KAS04_05990, partial [Candidatus Aenigmarchaeota archaeon]|nr:hypothetical protein [Candidatus Aenigmarchaeota archaeon]
DAVPSGTTDTYSSITAGSGAISIGKDGLTSFANGMIDEVMVFDDDLTQLQAADLRANILNGMPSWRLTHPKTFIRHWPLNNHTRDLMNGNDGTWVGTEAYTEGDYERSVGDFNGSSTISVPDSLATRFGLTDFSFSFSLNFGDGIGSNRGLLEKVEGTSFYEVIKSTADKIRFRIRDASSNLATCLSDTAVALGRTYHIICVCPRGETLRIYMDGRLDQDQGDTSGVGDISTTTALTLCDVSAVSEFKGGGSDFKLHSCALTSDEGKELFMMSMN